MMTWHDVREKQLDRRVMGILSHGASPIEARRSLIEIPRQIGSVDYQDLSTFLPKLELTEEDKDQARCNVVNYFIEREAFTSMPDDYADRYLRDIRRTMEFDIDAAAEAINAQPGQAVLETVHHWANFSVLYETCDQIKRKAPRVDRFILFHNRPDVDPRLVMLESLALSRVKVEFILICITSPIFKYFRQLVTENTVFLCMGDMPIEDAQTKTAAGSFATLNLTDGSGNVAAQQTLSLGSRLARMFKARHYKLDYPDTNRVEMRPVDSELTLRVPAKDWIFWPILGSYVTTQH
ncbi:hypothetical protein AIOL_001315 [Candidatus Rhodobacter oscarellae]|uniref:Uncharacterized protein n=1 Tax=Candidatus Rhodobacter oscarellae TaxID=1675527 RepID=A0A0J9GSA3_9RHOB|nr:hypothetical protein [Candidatus Rhodobacter lobularis]KMW56363.1 hypothetical protein AIOL_001315 [Candidatus Rhodobacter lobularis]